MHRLIKIGCWTFIFSMMAIPAIYSEEKVPLDQLLKEGRCKEAIELCQKKLNSSPKDNKDLNRALLLSKLAYAYYKDQDHERAFAVFAESLSLVQKEIDDAPSAEEAQIYEKALALYLNPPPKLHPSQATWETSKGIQNLLGSVVEEHPDYHQIKFLLAVSYANMGEFDKFFPLCFDAVSHYPHHFMAAKIKGMVQVKLFERERTAEGRDKRRKQALACFADASEKNPQDIGLNKLIICLSPYNEKAEAIEKYLGNILRDDRKIPRIDIFIYVREACLVQKYDLAKELIQRSKEWYEYSKSISSAEQYLNEEMKKSRG